MANLDQLFHNPTHTCEFQPRWFSNLATAAWTAPTVALGESTIARATMENEQHTILFIGTPFKTPYILYKTEMLSPFSKDVVSYELLHHVPSELSAVLRRMDRGDGLVLHTGGLSVLAVINAYEVEKLQVLFKPSRVEHV